MSSPEVATSPAKRAEEKPAATPPISGPIPPEMLAQMPPQIRQFIATAMSMGPAPNPIAAKMTAEHITEFLRLHGRSQELTHEDRKHSRKYAGVVAMTSIIATAGLITVLALSGQKDILMELVKAGIFISGGLGGGFGISEWRRRKED